MMMDDLIFDKQAEHQIHVRDGDLFLGILWGPDKTADKTWEFQAAHFLNEQRLFEIREKMQELLLEDI